MNFLNELNLAVTVCNIEGNIVYMNEKAISTFGKYGGKDLLGRSLFDCHNSQSCIKIREILKTGIPNTYTIEKNGVKKLIHQTPWFEHGKIAGLVEFSIETGFDMPHFIRS